VDAAGAVAGTYVYDTYGRTVRHTGSVSTPLQYTGQYTDSVTGFVYLRARYYDPATVQFVSAHNEPVRRRPDGRGDHRHRSDSGRSRNLVDRADRGRDSGSLR
jgi:RHS repeat-associated protein